ncbi:MAG: SGNH/GDSL hydrolase family protein [Firmicutes bacterium]|uniref:Lysophospholipase L1 n=1 Tax=Melghirimyces thermohalophilus TaxID=1236220 RepID=A0A1G6I9S7_9BACL|nr:SGNH/GDSL hydrolase family protein [Melghirimyces thermohalophilus]MDA8351786.1 SGNH/GDSL hydrolase family protein [Bacillota bacterium]SDC03133.1 Lysophospholipase L1 [Melghirimyces thermohalophilus]
MKRVGMVLIGILVLFGIAPGWESEGTAEEVNPKKRWVGAWTASQQEPSGTALEGIKDQTLRMIIHPHLDGNQARLRLSNHFGSQPVTFEDVYIGMVKEGASLVPRSNTRVTFDGEPSVTLDVGETVTSDRIHFKVKAGQSLAVSIYVPHDTGPVSWHRLAKQRSYISLPGNYASRTEPEAYTERVYSWYWLTGLDVLPHPGTTGGIVALGDSITDGAGSTSSANHRYPDFLAQRLREEGIRKSVMNAGISGNKVWRDDPVYGPSALNRLERDVLNQPGVTDVILLEGINDIGHEPPDYDAEHIIQGLKRIVDRAHQAGLRVYGGTLLPYKGSVYYTLEGEATREKVNEWIRNSGAFDGVIDFARIMADPSDPDRLNPVYDSGDHLHPSDAGYQAMAEAINLDWFRPEQPR